MTLPAINMPGKRNYLICFSGMDGAGKTTLARRLAAEMDSKGFRTHYVMARFESFQLLRPVRWVAKKTWLAGKKTDQSPEGVRTKRRLFGNRLAAAIWQNGLMTDYWFQLNYKVRWPRRRGRTVCADRYVYDTAVDLAADLDWPPAVLLRRLERLLRLAPRPDLVFLIDLPEETAYQRNLAKKDNLPLDYFRRRRGLFLTFTARPEVAVLDGAQAPEELYARIVRELKARGITL